MLWSFSYVVHATRIKSDLSAPGGYMTRSSRQIFCYKNAGFGFWESNDLLAISRKKILKMKLSLTLLFSACSGYSISHISHLSVVNLNKLRNMMANQGRQNFILNSDFSEQVQKDMAVIRMRKPVKNSRQAMRNRRMKNFLSHHNAARIQNFINWNLPLSLSTNFHIDGFFINY